MSKKRSKDNLRKIDKQSYGENDEIIRMVKVFAGVILSLLAFYFVFAIYNGEISFGEEEGEKVPVEIQNVEILAGSTFNRTEDEYYVLMYDFGGNNATKCVAIHNLYMTKSNVAKMYLVDLGHVFNREYVVTERTNVNVSSVDTMKVMEPTLIKVRAGKAEFVKAGLDEIKDYESTLLK